MAAAANSAKDARQGARNTPGRRGRTGNQYFDVGKVGRKTGIVLKDTGVRDEHGMEPMAGIFSSPYSPQKAAEGTSSSNAMELQESSAPDVDETLHMRKTPRLPPPRATTPRHTNIGSPKRMSSARPQSRNADPNMDSEPSPNRAASQPPANRVLNFGRQGARMSVDNGSPFKPKRVLRRSFGGPRNDQFEEGSERPMDTEIAEEDEEDAEESEAEAEAGADAEPGSDEPQPFQIDQPDAPSSDDDAPPMFDNNEDFYDAQRESDDAEINEALEHAESILQTTPTTAPAAAKARGRPRKSDQTIFSQHTPQTTQTTSSSKKRDRTEMEEEENVADDDGDDVENQTLQSIEQSQNEVPDVSATSDNPPKRKRGRPRKSDNNETSQVSQVSQVSITTDNAAKRKPGRPRKSDISVLQDPVNADESRQDVEQDENDTSQVSAATEGPARKRPGRPRKSDVTVVTDSGEQTIDPGDMAHGDSYLAPINEDDEAEVEAAPASPVTKKKPGRKPKAQKATKPQKTPKERDPDQSMRQTPTGSPGTANGRDLALSRSPSKRAGSVSNVNLRASTPFEDAHQRMSRSGRPIMAPLKHWAGESYVWKNGEVEGIIRADEVKTPRGDKKKKMKGRRRAPRAGASNGLDMIAEESDTESTVPDEWEEQVGVIAGTVAAWDPDLQQGIPDDPIREDIAFASSSIVTRDVAGSSFQYAKIMTLPFFGSGIVELPPEGFKRAKNSRKMQMVFFVHEGKVLVTVGPPAVEQNGRGVSGGEAETNEFAISKGGVWVVPRGNNYSISNESRTKNARIFFAQGCEMVPEMVSQSAAE